VHGHAVWQLVASVFGNAACARKWKKALPDKDVTASIEVKS
jgi:hypothetical protein